MFQKNLPKSNIQEVMEMGFKLRSESKAIVIIVLGDLLPEWISGVGPSAGSSRRKTFVPTKVGFSSR